jgi:outer membrane immunogenic protein
MTKISTLLTTVATVAILSAVPALAADMRMPVKAPPAMAAVFNWTGFYIGVHGGGGWSRARWQFDATPGISTNHSGDGGFVGGQIGYNWQPMGSPWVFGVELDGAWADISGATLCPNPAFTCGHQIDALATFRGRIGYAFGEVLLYGTGGAAYADVNWTAVTNPGGVLFGTGFNGTDWGWAAGAGVEWAFAPKWSVKFEYMHYDFGRETAPPGAVGGGAARLGLSIDTAKAGVNYRF